MSSSAVSVNAPYARKTATRNVSYRLMSVKPATATSPQVHSLANGSAATRGARSQAQITRANAYARQVSVFVVYAMFAT